MNQSRLYSMLTIVLVVVMFMFFALIILPDAKAEGKPFAAHLILQIEDEELRIYEYETPRMLCHVSIIDVKMIGAQASVSCALKNRRPALPHRELNTKD